jgi:hypothetical protein
MQNHTLMPTSRLYLNPNSFQSWKDSIYSTTSLASRFATNTEHDEEFAARLAFGCQRLTGIGKRLSGNLNMGKQVINLSARFCRIFSGHIMHF